MQTLLIILLSIALLVTLFLLWQTRSTVIEINRTLVRAIPHKPETGILFARDRWAKLSKRTNELLAENERLQRVRSDQLAQFTATLGSLQEAVLIIDATNTVLLANKAFHAIFPNAVNILGHRIEHILPFPPFLDHVRAVKAGEAEARREIEFITGSISTCVEITGTTVAAPNDSHGPWVLFVLHDITRQKKLEGMRKEFVANVSHELRTPLSLIKGFIETLVDGGDSVAPQDRDRFLRTVHRHTERLSSLIDDLLALSRLESTNPGLKRETVDLHKLVADVVADFQSRTEAGSHPLAHDVDKSLGPILADPLKIAQALDNLLDNARKYTPNGTRLHVGIRLLGREVEVSVSDNGPGIPAEDLPHIFERFYRVEKGRARDKGGTGLGLSIVKHIVQLHGGRVWAESRLGEGTSFHFTLPTRTGA